MNINPLPRAVYDIWFGLAYPVHTLWRHLHALGVRLLRHRAVRVRSVPEVHEGHGLRAAVHEVHAVDGPVPAAASARATEALQES